jgi:hypothetical protein
MSDFYRFPQLHQISKVITCSCRWQQVCVLVHMISGTRAFAIEISIARRIPTGCDIRALGAEARYCKYAPSGEAGD